MATGYAPSSMYRSREGMGIWEHRGKVAAVGVGHSPTERRWDEKPETSVGSMEHHGTKKCYRRRRGITRSG